MKVLYILISIILLSSCYLGEELPPDQQTWKYDVPSDVNLIEDHLLDVDLQIKSGLFEFIGGLIIIKDDKLVFENYYIDSISRETIIPLDESSLVFTVAAIGIAEDLGLLNRSDKIQNYLPDHQDFFGIGSSSRDTLKQDITIDHLLNHKAGFAWNESVAVTQSEDNLFQMMNSDDWIAFILNRPMEAIPGTRYNFNSGSGTILSKIIENASNQPFNQFLRTELFNAIDISTTEIAKDPSGNFDGGRGLSISLIDWTKFTYLILNEGTNKGRKVIDPNFVEDATTFQNSVSVFENIGYGWKLFGSAYENTFPFSIEDAYFLQGATGQDQYVITSQNMIISIYAENFFDSSDNSFELFREIISAIP